MPKRRPLVAGNWKMNGLLASAAELDAMLQGAAKVDGADLLVCPPATLVAHFAERAKGSKLRIGAQDCHRESSGAFTGDISAEMLADAGASAVIVGHSERRQYHHESDADVRRKAEAAHRAGLLAIVCIGETREQREAAETLPVIAHQLEGSLPEKGDPTGLAVAYEPVWAIGTGLTPTTAQVGEVHAYIRTILRGRYGEAGEAIRILYGGSVKPSNAAELMAVNDVDGALVGGASLKATDFLAICAAYR
jgi:triosephosphate isomerase